MNCPRHSSASSRMASCWQPMALVLWVAGSCLVAVPAAHATVPHLIRYQGTLADTQQVPLEGTYTLTFRLYDATTGGTNVWEETQTNVPLTKGQFSVLLGQVTPLDLAFDKDLWLSIQVNTDAEMTPRQQLSSVPYAYRSAVAETAQVALTAQNMKTTAIEDDGNKFVPIGGIILWRGASCPVGYTRVTEFAGKHLVGGTTAGIDQGADTQSLTITVANLAPHVHAGPSHAHTLAPHTHTIGVRGTYAGANYPPSSSYDYSDTITTSASGGGETGASGTGDTGSTGTGVPIRFDNRPAGRTILLCEKQ